MKVIRWTGYGPPEVLQLGEAPKPVPKDNQVLIKVRGTTVTTGDCEMRRLDFPLWWIKFPMRVFVGIRKPKRITIPGSYLAGDVEAVGKEVTQFEVGDPVFGMTGLAFGTYAEYVCAAETGVLALKPANMTYEEAAAVPLGGLEALHFLRAGKVRPGDKVLINGAGGSIGTFGIQLAKHFGADVTAVDSAEKLAMLSSIGADHVIDFTQEDYTQNGETYDLILDIIGKSPFAPTVRSLTPNGRFVIANPSGFIQALRSKWVSSRGSKQVLIETTNPKAEDLRFLKELIEAGVVKTVVDKRYSLEEMVEAHRYAESGHKRGNIVITVAHD